MASHGADANGATNFPSTIPELLKILPKRETTLQIRMGGNHSGSSHHSFNDNNNRSSGQGSNNNNRHHNNNHHSHNHRHSNNNSTNSSFSSTSNSSSSSTSSQSNGAGPSYHTLRYDFKPASINSEQPAAMELTSTGQVTIKAPNVGGSISSQTVFRGQRRPHVKECLLVIDHSTGEMVLQKLTDNITVKATRNLGGGGGSGAGGSNATGTNANSGGSSSGGGGGSSIVAPISNGGSVITQLGNGSLGSNHVNYNPATPNSGTHISAAPTGPSSHDDLLHGPQLSEDSSSSSGSSSSSRSRTSSSSSSSSSSNSGNSSPNTEGFTF